MSRDKSINPNLPFQGQGLTPGQAFCHYEIQEELGYGGMGAVYRAYDKRLERMVALKVLIAGPLSSSKNIQRFMQEARVLAALKHPHIVQIYEIGERPQNYFTMEYVEGDTLAQLIKEGHLSLQESALIIKKTAEALQLAHRNGILHRDIKPSNIMVGPDREPKIMDFGIAKNIRSSLKLSLTGDLLGTPAYMSPEQANSKSLDRKSDIYSLGATLYECICRRPPFQGENHLKVLSQIAFNDPVAPRMLNPDIPKDLETICLKCLDKKPARRYVNARLLVEDLELYLHGKNIRARSVGYANKLGKWTLRNKTLVAFITSTFLMLLAMGMLFYTFLFHQDTEIKVDPPALFSKTNNFYDRIIWHKRITDVPPMNSMTLADTDRDGEPEIICFASSGSITAYGLHQQKHLWHIEKRDPLCSFCYQTQVADINKDGQLDVISGNYSKLTVFDGGTHSEIFWVANYWGTAFALGDANDDGYDDYILTRKYKCKIQCYNSQNSSLLWESNLPRDKGFGRHCYPVWFDKHHLLHGVSGQLYLLDIRNGGIKMYAPYGKLPPEFILTGLQGKKKVAFGYSKQEGVFAQDLTTEKILWQNKHAPFNINGMALADIDQDRKPELLVHLDQLYCLNAENGKEKWRFDTQPYHSVGFCPLVADLNGDKQIEIIVYSRDRYLYPGRQQWE